MASSNDELVLDGQESLETQRANLRTIVKRQVKTFLLNKWSGDWFPIDHNNQLSNHAEDISMIFERIKYLARTRLKNERTFATFAIQKFADILIKTASTKITTDAMLWELVHLVQELEATDEGESNYSFKCDGAIFTRILIHHENRDVTALVIFHPNVITYWTSLVKKFTITQTSNTHLAFRDWKISWKEYSHEDLNIAARHFDILDVAEFIPLMSSRELANQHYIQMEPVDNNFHWPSEMLVTSTPNKATHIISERPGQFAVISPILEPKDTSVSGLSTSSSSSDHYTFTVVSGSSQFKRLKSLASTVIRPQTGATPIVRMEKITSKSQVTVKEEDPSPRVTGHHKPSKSYGTTPLFMKLAKYAGRAPHRQTARKSTAGSVRRPLFSNSQIGRKRKLFDTSRSPVNETIELSGDSSSGSPTSMVQRSQHRTSSGCLRSWLATHLSANSRSKETTNNSTQPSSSRQGEQDVDNPNDTGTWWGVVEPMVPIDTLFNFSQKFIAGPDQEKKRRLIADLLVFEVNSSTPRYSLAGNFTKKQALELIDTLLRRENPFLASMIKEPLASEVFQRVACNPRQLPDNKTPAVRTRHGKPCLLDSGTLVDEILPNYEFQLLNEYNLLAAGFSAKAVANCVQSFIRDNRLHALGSCITCVHHVVVGAHNYDSSGNKLPATEPEVLEHYCNNRPGGYLPAVKGHLDALNVAHRLAIDDEEATVQPFQFFHQKRQVEKLYQFTDFGRQLLTIHPRSPVLSEINYLTDATDGEFVIDALTTGGRTYLYADQPFTRMMVFLEIEQLDAIMGRLQHGTSDDMLTKFFYFAANWADPTVINQLADRIHHHFPSLQNFHYAVTTAQIDGQEHATFIKIYGAGFVIELFTPFHFLIARGSPMQKAWALVQMKHLPMKHHTDENFLVRWARHEFKTRIYDLHRPNGTLRWMIRLNTAPHEMQCFCRDNFWTLAPLYPTIMMPYLVFNAIALGLPMRGCEPEPIMNNGRLLEFCGELGRLVLLKHTTRTNPTGKLVSEDKPDMVCTAVATGLIEPTFFDYFPDGFSVYDQVGGIGTTHHVTSLQLLFTLTSALRASMQTATFDGRAEFGYHHMATSRFFEGVSQVVTKFTNMHKAQRAVRMYVEPVAFDDTASRYGTRYFESLNSPNKPKVPEPTLKKMHRPAAAPSLGVDGTQWKLVIDLCRLIQVVVTDGQQDVQYLQQRVDARHSRKAKTQQAKTRKH